jgi:hypothetical protein
MVFKATFNKKKVLGAIKPKDLSRKYFIYHKKDCMYIYQYDVGLHPAL